MGILRYSGYPIEELAESSTYLEVVAYLLIYGNLPSQSQLADWEFTVTQHSAVPQGILEIIQAIPHDAHPMGVLVSAMSAPSVFHPDANPALRGQDLYQSKQVRQTNCTDSWEGAIGLINQIPALPEYWTFSSYSTLNMR